MQLKPTVLAYVRLMAAHLVGRIQPPPISPLAEATAPRRPSRPPRRRAPRRAGQRRATMSAGAARRRRRRRRPRHGRWPCASPQAGARGHAARARRRRSAASPAPMDFGGHEVDRFYHVIVPVRRAHDRAGRGARARRPAALHARSAPASSPTARCTTSTASATSLRFSPLTPARRALRLGVVRRPVPAAQHLRRARGRSRSSSWLRRHCGTRVVRADLEAAARLALRRRPRRAAGHLPLGAHAAHVAARATQGAAARTMGHIVGGHQRLIDASARARARARRRDPHSAPPVEGLALTRTAPSPASRSTARRARSTSRSRRCSRRRCASCCPSALQRAARRLPAALPRVSSA